MCGLPAQLADQLGPGNRHARHSQALVLALALKRILQDPVGLLGELARAEGPRRRFQAGTWFSADYDPPRVGGSTNQ